MDEVYVQDVVPAIQLYALPSRTPLYADYYLADRDFRYRRLGTEPAYRPVRVWSSLAERRKWLVGVQPTFSLVDLGSPRGPIVTSLSYNPYLTRRVKRFCTQEVLLYTGSARIIRSASRHPYRSEDICIHLEVSDDEYVKLKEVVSDVAFVVEEPKDSGVLIRFQGKGKGKGKGKVKERFNNLSDLYRFQFNGNQTKLQCHLRRGMRIKIKLSPTKGKAFMIPTPPSNPPCRRDSTTPAKEPHPTPPAKEPHPTPPAKEPHPKPPASQHPSTPTQSEHPSTPTQSEHPSTPTQSEHPSTPTPSEHPPTPTPSEHPPTPTQSERGSKSPQSQHQSTQTRNETPTPDPTGESSRKPEPKQQFVKPPIIILRNRLPSLKKGDPVLARWEDDRWYYSGKIIEATGSHSYRVGDNTGRVEEMWREDIILKEDNYLSSPNQKRRKHEDYVLAPHPVYSWSYAPGCVIAQRGDRLTVLFYDGRMRENIDGYNVYPALSPEKHCLDVKDIQQRERDWIGQTAIIRDDTTGYYKIGHIKKQIGQDQKYKVKWNKWHFGEQRSIHIYGKYTVEISFKVGDYILACVDPDKMRFLPGQVTNVNTHCSDILDVEFVNGERCEVKADDSFWLNERFYSEAKELFMRVHHECESFAGNNSDRRQS